MLLNVLLYKTCYSHDDTPLDLNKWKAYLRVARGITDFGTFVLHTVLTKAVSSVFISCYRQALNINEGEYRAWYGFGETYEMLHLYQYATYYYKRDQYTAFSSKLQTKQLLSDQVTLECGVLWSTHSC